MTDNNELIAKLLISWTINPSYDFSEDYCKSDFIYRVLSKKLEWAELNIRIPIQGYMVLTICSNDNPGYAQLLLSELIKIAKLRSNNENLELTANDFAHFMLDNHYNEYPILEDDPNSYWYKSFMAKWDAQKINGVNAVDTKEFWDNL